MLGVAEDFLNQRKSPVVAFTIWDALFTGTFPGRPIDVFAH